MVTMKLMALCASSSLLQAINRVGVWEGQQTLIHITLSFHSYFHFIFYLILSFLSFVSLTFTFALSFIFYTTSLIVELHLGTECYNHSLVWIHFESHHLIKRLFGLKKLKGSQSRSMCLLSSSLEQGSNSIPSSTS
jgi:hypothetical protein